MTKSGTRKKQSFRSGRKILLRINKAHIPGVQLMQFSKEVHRLEPGDQTFEGITVTAVRFFDGDPDHVMSAYFRMRALAEIVSSGRLPGWTGIPQPDGSVMTHPALFDAAGQAPLQSKGDNFVFNRAIFLKRSFQLAKLLKRKPKSDSN